MPSISEGAPAAADSAQETADARTAGSSYAMGKYVKGEEEKVEEDDGTYLYLHPSEWLVTKVNTYTAHSVRPVIFEYIGIQYTY